MFFTDANADGVITAADILQDEHYYPFGLSLSDPRRVVPPPAGQNDYRYNGKELTEALGLNWYFYGARWYDAAVGRWWSGDPLAEKNAGWSPYNYTFNNPIIYVDPDGRDAILIIKPGENGANGTITVTLTFNYDKSQGNAFVESAVSSFQSTWGNAGASIAGNFYKGNSFSDIDVNGQKYDVTYQLELIGTDNVSGATREGTNSLTIIADDNTEGSNYSEGNMNYRASQEKSNNNTNFGHELSHVLGIGHNDKLKNENGKTSVSAGGTTDRGVIRQDVVNSVQEAVNLARRDTPRSVVTLTTDRGGSGRNTVNLKQGKNTVQSRQYPVPENQAKQK